MSDEKHGFFWTDQLDGERDLMVDGKRVGKVYPIEGECWGWTYFDGDGYTQDEDEQFPTEWKARESLAKFAALERPLARDVEPGDFLLARYGNGTQVVFVDDANDKTLGIWRLYSLNDRYGRQQSWQRGGLKRLSRFDIRIIKRLGSASGAV